jgi:hypothetical protein
MSDAIECPKCGHPPRDISDDYVPAFKSDFKLNQRPATPFGHCRTGHRLAVVVTLDEPPHVMVLEP